MDEVSKRLLFFLKKDLSIGNTLNSVSHRPDPLYYFFFGRRLTDLFVVRRKRPILFAWMIFTAWALAHPFFFLFLLQDINQKWDWISSLLLYKFIQFAGFQYHNRLNSIRESSIYSAFRLALSLCQRKGKNPCKGRVFILLPIWRKELVKGWLSLCGRADEARSCMSLERFSRNHIFLPSYALHIYIFSSHPFISSFFFSFLVGNRRRNRRTYSQRRQHQAARKIQQFMRQSKNK